jgi:hypothetical protein
MIGETMKKIILATSMILLASCASTNGTRNIASVEKDLSGNYLGVSDYKFGHSGPNKAATRIYLHEIEGERGHYHAVLLEYVNLLKIAPSYVISNKMPFIAKKVGYLNSITSKISAYKVIPRKEEGTYDMWPLVVDGDKIKAKRDGKPRVLTLSKEDNLESPLAGATISPSREDEPQQIFFPTKDDDKINGTQYSLAKLTYKKAKLESTWRKNFLTGPYLAQYAKVDDVVLDLSGAGDNKIAEFKLNDFDTKMSEKKRKKIFTNEKSAFLKGEFSVTEPLDGMYVLSPINGDEKTKSVLKGKIGLFIDVFDATKSLNQDVVELAFIDSERPEDFLMYYEHPNNGEGK